MISYLNTLYQIHPSKTKKFNNLCSAEVLDRFIQAVEINTRDALISVRSTLVFNSIIVLIFYFIFFKLKHE